MMPPIPKNHFWNETSIAIWTYLPHHEQRTLTKLPSVTLHLKIPHDLSTPDDHLVMGWQYTQVYMEFPGMTQ